MPTKYARPRSQSFAAASVVFLTVLAPLASAEPRAPIVYAYGAGVASEQSAKASLKLLGTDKATQRIEFRYPGQYNGPVRVEQASVSVPKAPEPVKETVWTETPQFGPVPSAFDAVTTVAGLGAQPVVSATALAAVPAAVSAPLAGTTNPIFTQTGIAIVYGDEFAGLETSNGEIFDQSALTAAHPSLPLPSLVRVANPATGQEVIVRVNDRGPFEDGAVLQVSRQAARALGFEGAGKAELKLQLIGPAPTKTDAKRSESKPVPILASVRTPKADELLGGDELAGGPAMRPAVVWPEPPTDWGVRNAKAQPVNAGVAGAHYVQLASFSDIKNADALLRDLQANLPVEIVPARVNGSDYYRVRVGPVDSRATAQELRDRLNAEGKGDGRVVTAE